MYKLIINLKAYDEGIDKNALKIAKACSELESYAKKKKVEIIICGVAFDLKDLVKSKVKVYSQHVDPVMAGSQTGFIVPNQIKKLGVKGTLLNHSEHQVQFKILEEAVKVAKKAGLEVCVCARNEVAAKQISTLNPDYIAVEPKELIGGDISISTARPSLISSSKAAVGHVSLLVGAGVKNKDDVRKSIELGAKGILVASGVVKARNKKAAIKDLLDGF